MIGHRLEDLTIGQSAERAFPVTDEAVRAFSAVSGDENPLHLDEAFAATTVFKGRVAHGMLPGAYISAVLGADLPGPGAVYVSQTLNFKRPVRIGDVVTVTVTVTEIEEAKGRVTLSTVCRVGGKSVVTGEAVVLAPRRAV